MRLPLTARLAPLALLLITGAAAAQDAPPRDPLDDATVRIGPIGITPTFVIRDIGRDYNVFNEPTNPKEDFTATISPKADVLVHSGPLLMTYTTTTDYVYYKTYKSQRGTNVGSSLRMDFDFGPVRPFASVGGANTRERFNREIDQRARHRDLNYAGGLRIQLLESVFATVSARQSTIKFDATEFRGERLDRALDETSDAVDVGGGVALTPLTTVQVIVTKQRDHFALAPERNSDTLRIMPTVTFSPLAILSGSAALGYRRFTTTSGLVPDFRGFVATLTLSTTIREKQRFDTVFSRDIQYSYEQDATYYLETGVQGTWTWQIAGPIDVRLMGSRSRLHYEATALTAANDDDTAFSYGLGLGFHVHERFRIGLNGEWRQRESERAADRTFQNHRIYANLTWGKQ